MPPLKFQSFYSTTDTEIPISGIPISSDESYQKADFTPLAAVVDAFEQISAVLKAKGLHHDLDLKSFCDACSLVSVLFGCLGIAFKFAEMEYVSKVNGLAEASQRYRTLNSILDYNTQNNSVRTQGSLSRNLRRVRQGLNLIRALFQNFLSSNDYCLKDAASAAYAETCAPYHSWAVKTAAYAGMYALPTRDQLLLKLNETEISAEKEMIRYINASLPVIEYIDNLYISRRISLDW
ncbi:ACD11 homolog protein-like [Salvia splendens]|uniref:ACD11 homolog protein-like n=1 Tax=Salvia splendens TaxID=180675 RepID=UPI001C257694|nr:ACD11 homolog protein-like [Salvia splendens]